MNNDYICTQEPVEKQLSDYKKSTKLWSTRYFNRSMYLTYSIIIIFITNFMWFGLLSYLYGKISKDDYKLVCIYRNLPLTGSR